MNYYYSNRQQYGTLSDFIPQIQAYISYLPTIIDQIAAEREVNRHPYIVSIYPAPNSVLDLSHLEIEITVRFAQEMLQTTMTDLFVKSLKHSEKSNKAVRTEWLDDQTLKCTLSTKTACEIGFMAYSSMPVVVTTKHYRWILPIIIPPNRAQTGRIKNCR